MTEGKGKEQGKEDPSAVDAVEAVGAGCCLLELLSFGLVLGLLAFPAGLLPG